jgi:hypothetical protein
LWLPKSGSPQIAIEAQLKKTPRKVLIGFATAIMIGEFFMVLVDGRSLNEIFLALFAGPGSLITLTALAFVFHFLGWPKHGHERNDF